jgi:hypothetical protein
MIRRDIEQTRSALTEKLETLEHEVRGAVQETRDAVTGTVNSVKGTVDSVKGSVEGAITSVKQTFDVKRQVRQHPWPMMGASVLTGVVIGAYLPSPASIRRGSRAEPERRRLEAEPRREFARSEEPPARGPSWLSNLLQRFQPELQKIEGIAIGAALNLVGESLKGTLPPSLEPQVQDVIQSITRKVAGHPGEAPIPGSQSWLERSPAELRSRT